MLVTSGFVMRAHQLTTAWRRMAPSHIPLESIPAHLVFEV